MIGGITRDSMRSSGNSKRSPVIIVCKSLLKTIHLTSRMINLITRALTTTTIMTAVPTKTTTNKATANIINTIRLPNSIEMIKAMRIFHSMGLEEKKRSLVKMVAITIKVALKQPL